METQPKVEESLPEKAGESGTPGEHAPNLDGLSAAVAVEHGAGKAESGNAGNSPENGSAGKRGRPPTHGLYSKAMGSNGKDPVKAAGPGPVAIAEGAPVAPAAPRVSIPPELLAKVVKEGLTSAENFVGHKMEGVARRAGLTHEEIEPQLKQAELGDSRKQIVADLIPLVLQEHGLDAQMSPTVAVCFLLGPWSVSCGTAYMTLAKLAEEKMQMEKAKKAA